MIDRRNASTHAHALPPLGAGPLLSSSPPPFFFLPNLPSIFSLSPLHARAPTGHNARIFDVAPAPAASSAFAGWLASASEDDAVRVWRPNGGGNGSDPTDFALAAPFRGHADPVLRVSWHAGAPDSGILASASGDRTARVWQLQATAGGGAGGGGSGRWAAAPLATLGGHAEEVYACEFLPSADVGSDAALRLVTASGPGLEAWEVRPDGQAVRTGAAAPCAVGVDAAGGEKVLLDGELVTDRIRTEEAGNLASIVARYPAVRAALLERQRAFAQPPGLVADGRDMGTVVFPAAELKIFLTASPEERARRRYNQLKDKGLSVSLADLSRDIAERDHRDASRTLAPLVAAADAISLDSTGVSPVEIVARVLALARRRL